MTSQEFKRIRREVLKMTQLELAKELGYSVRMVNYFENIEDDIFKIPKLVEFYMLVMGAPWPPKDQTIPT